MTQPEGSLAREALEAWTLLLLRDQPAHGYELDRRLHERGFRRPGPRLYRLLRDLERGGLARSDWAPSSEVGPERRVYRLTSRGARQLHEDADILQRRNDALRLFLEHYAEPLDDRESEEGLP